jgi:hypothetical protein
MADLGRWLSEDYRVREDDPAVPEDAPDGPDSANHTHETDD